MNETYIQNNERIKEEIRYLNLTSDFFLSVALEDKAACEYVLKILMNNTDLKVIDVKTQYSIRQIGTHSVVLDVIAEDNTGKVYEIEMQTGDKKGHIRRVRYITSSIDTSFLNKGYDYTQLPEVHIFYITTFDIANANETVYDIIRTDKKNHIEFDNGVHEHYINTVIDDGSRIATLMNYFKNTDSNNMEYGSLSKRVKYLKENEGGNSYMCELIDKVREEGIILSKISTIRKMYKKNMNLKQITDILDDDNDINIIYNIITKFPDKNDEWVYNKLISSKI